LAGHPNDEKKWRNYPNEHKKDTLVEKELFVFGFVFSPKAVLLIEEPDKFFPGLHLGPFVDLGHTPS
jgi:hypothetical protein